MLRRSLRVALIHLLLLAAPAAGQGDSVVLLTGSPAGTYFRFGSAIADIVHASNPALHIFSTGSQGSVDNIFRLVAGDGAFAIVQSDIAHAAAKGEEPFSVRRSRGFGAVMGLFYEDLLIIARHDLQLRSAASIRPGMRVVVGVRQSGTLTNARHVLEAIGLDIGVVEAVYREPRSALPLLAQDSADVVFLTAGLDDDLVKLVSDNGGEIVPLGGEVTPSLRDGRPYYEPTTLSVTGHEVATVRIRTLLIASQSVPAKTVREVAATLHRQLGALRAAHPRGAQILPSNIAEVPVVAFHPGARAYYCSAGLMACDRTPLWATLLTVVVVATLLAIWFNDAARQFVLRAGPAFLRSFLGQRGVTDRFRYVVTPFLVLTFMLTGSVLVRESERLWARDRNIRSDFEDIRLDENLVWMLVFTATGFEDGRFPKSPAGKITSAMMSWVGIDSILLLVGFVTSDQ